MKNPIRAYVAKIVREEIYAVRRESNLKAIQEEIDNAVLRDFYKRRPTDKWTIGESKETP